MTFWSDAHLFRRAVADLLAVIEHDDAVGDVHHHAHVVLDQHDRRAVVVVDVEDEAAHVLLLLDVHAGHRFVEQQDGRLGGQRAAQFDALLQSVGQARHRRLADVLDLEELDDFLDRRAVFGFLAAGAGQLQRDLEEGRVHMQIAAGHDVVQHRHALEQRDVLKGRAMPSLAACVGVMPARRSPRKVMLPSCGT